MSKTLAFLTALLMTAHATASYAEDDSQNHWDWYAEAYFWGADLGGSTTSGGNIFMPIEDIVDDLQFGVMGTVAATRGNWLLFADAFYLDVEEDDSVSASIGPLSAKVDGSVELKGFSSTFGGGYRVFDNQSTTVYGIGGVRVLWLDADVEVDATESIGSFPIAGQAVSESESGTNWDAVIGFRGQTDLSDKWYVSYYGDIGTGDSDLTWQASIAANYRMKRADLVLGYRYLDFDFDDFGPIDDLNLGGPFLGLKFRF